MPREAESVCCSFVKAGEHLDLGRGSSKRVGLVETDSMRVGATLHGLERAMDGRPIFDAWSDEPWTTDVELKARWVERSRASG